MAAETMTLPSLLLVPGAWHCGLHFGPLIDQLEKEHGFRCFTIDLPSTEDPDAVNSIDADTETVRNAVINILDETVKPDDKVSGDLVVLMHSYGGVPGSNALEGLSKTQRAKEGKRGGVIGIAYMAAFLTDEGYSVATTLTGDAEDWLSVPWKAVEVVTLSVHTSDFVFSIALKYWRGCSLNYREGVVGPKILPKLSITTFPTRRLDAGRRS